MSDSTTDKVLLLRLKDELSPQMAKAIGNVENLHSSLLNLHAALEVGHRIVDGAEKAWEFLSDKLERSFEAAMGAEKAQNKLTGALIGSGQYTTELNEKIEEHVKLLEQTVGANGEASKSEIAAALQMGLSAKQAMAMEEASRKLASATDGDVNRAFSLLQGTLAGNSRGLAKVLPQVKELSAAQMKQGDSIALVNKLLASQYDIYIQSLPAAIQKSQVAYQNLYIAAGQVLTASPALKSAINEAALMFQEMAKYIEDNKVGLTMFVNQGVMLLAEAAPIAIKALAGLDAMFTGLKVGAEALMTGFVKLWQFQINLADKIPGVSSAFRAMGVDLKGVSKSLGDFTGKTMDNAKASLVSLAKRESFYAGLDNIVERHVRVVDAAGTKNAAATKKETDAIEKAREAESLRAAAALHTQQVYAGFTMGTSKQREQLDAEIQGREKDLNDFQKYLAAKERLAVSKAEEQQIQLNKIQADAMKGSGGAEESKSGSNAAVAAEIQKQAQLDVLFKKGILTKAAYNEASLASDQRAATAELAFDLANEQARTDALGQSDAGFMLKQQLAEKHFQQEEADKIARAMQAGASQAQIDSMKAADTQGFLATAQSDKEAFIEKDIAQNEKLNRGWQVMLGKIELAQAKHGKVLGTLNGVVQSETYKNTEQGLNNLASLRNSHSRAAFELGKDAAIAEATMSTFASAVYSYTGMVETIPGPVGIALGVAAAAASVASGFVQIQNIASQQFGGGQADSGLDSVPNSLAGKSFILSAGERVIQPEANRKLTKALDEGSMGGGDTHNYHLNVNMNGTVSAQDARRTAQVMIEEIRRASQRGQPIVDTRGITGK